MKRLLLVFIPITLLLTSCFFVNSKDEEERAVALRDYSITAANAYSQLFLDSNRLETYITAKKLDDTLANKMRSFYNTRNFQYAWFSNDGFTEQANSFWNLYDHYLTYSGDTALENKSLQRKMNSLLHQENLHINSSNTNFQNTELMLTDVFFRYADKNFEDGSVRNKELIRFIPLKKQDPMQMADSIMAEKVKSGENATHINQTFTALKGQLQTYYDIAQKGGFPQISISKNLKKGSSDAAIINIKRYLRMTGDLSLDDTSALYNDTLETAVINYQERFGFNANGIIDNDMVQTMNVPAAQRLKQILINLERMRWMPKQPDGTMILVNIPEFVLHVQENGKESWSMNVVVGKDGHNTMMFTGSLNQVVFSPYWNVPPSIVKNEIMPAMEQNPNYLEEQHMEIVDKDKGDDEEGSLPTIRQLPGNNNALGKVKFLFPNSYNIYFHDTPSKSLFNKEKRAFSHGCIRLSEPVKMAEYLLRNDANWDAARIAQAMNSGEEKYVRLKDPVEVFITYNTAWVDSKGRLNFRDDIYDHDKRIAGKYFL